MLRVLVVGFFRTDLPGKLSQEGQIKGGPVLVRSVYYLNIHSVSENSLLIVLFALIFIRSLKNSMLSPFYLPRAGSVYQHVLRNFLWILGGQQLSLEFYNESCPPLSADIQKNRERFQLTRPKNKAVDI